MKQRTLLFLICTFLAPVILLAQKPKPPNFAHTFSIVARDAQTGEMGVAVQSHWFSVGAIVPWAEAGVGAVATQSFVDASYGPLGLNMMKVGRSAPDALRGLLEADEGRQVRQVAMIDNEGRVAAWTGCNCVDSAGEFVNGAGNSGMPSTESGCAHPSYMRVGKDFSVQANMMLNDKIWGAMAKGFQETKGDLADRMMAALDAAQAAGGDARGRQSAAIIVVKAKASGRPWDDRIFDLRVEDNPTPLKELRRLISLQRAYNHMNAGDLAVEKKDNEGALREYSAAEKIASSIEGVDPSRLAEMIYWHAQALAQMGRVDESLPLFKKAFSIYPNWVMMTPRVAKSGLLPNDPKVLERIMSQAPKQ